MLARARVDVRLITRCKTLHRKCTGLEAIGHIASTRVRCVGRSKRQKKPGCSGNLLQPPHDTFCQGIASRYSGRSCFSAFEITAIQGSSFYGYDRRLECRAYSSGRDSDTTANEEICFRQDTKNSVQEIGKEDIRETEQEEEERDDDAKGPEDETKDRVRGTIGHFSAMFES